MAKQPHGTIEQPQDHFEFFFPAPEKEHPQVADFEAKEEPSMEAQLVPYEKPTLHFLPAYLDIDMFFVRLFVGEMGHISNF